MGFGQGYTRGRSEVTIITHHPTPITHHTMELHFTGIIIAVSTFLIIGLCHPLVIKQEYYSGTKYWWTYLLVGIVCIAVAFIAPNWFESERVGIAVSAILGVTGHRRTRRPEEAGAERLVSDEPEASSRIRGSRQRRNALSCLQERTETSFQLQALKPFR